MFTDYSPSLEKFDPFGQQKREAFHSSLPAMKGLEDHLNSLVSNKEIPSQEVLKKELFQFIRVSLLHLNYFLFSLCRNNERKLGSHYQII
jgi:hypothetical protein